MSRNVYLEDIGLEEAMTRWERALTAAGLDQPLPGEWTPLAQALGRVTAEPVWALNSAPHYHAAAMDGYAVRAADTVGALETAPRRLTVPDQARPVDTGHAIPPGFDAVVMIEQVHEIEIETETGMKKGAAIEILAAAAPWQHVRPLGEDMVAGELVLPANHRLRPQDVGAAAGCGHTKLLVRRRPRVAIQPTGSELVQPGSQLEPGDVVEYNSLMLAGLTQEWGGEALRLPPVPDDAAQIKAAVLAALHESDLVVINAGSSAGSHDFTADVLREIGEVQVHGIAMRPGHPVILGVAQGKAVAGIPGYPASALITFDLLIEPLLARWQGQLPTPRPTLTAALTRKVVSPLGEDEFVRVTVGKVGDRFVATPIQRGAGVITSLVKADGIVRVSRFSAGLQPGATATVELLRDPAAIANTIVAIGSHDLTLDVLADHLRRRFPQLTFSSSNVGSYGGLLALARNEAHLAGAHLLDEETGQYNSRYVAELLPGQAIVLLGFVQRTQGLIIPPGNPKRINTLADLTRPDVVFINRQRGAGTRVLLDYRLKQAGLDPRRIQGYDRQEFTHLAAAAAVKSGAADCTLGILAAARALDLDFIPLAEERYDLVMRQAVYESELLQPLLTVMRDAAFRLAVERLGGYGTADLGKVLS